MVPNDGSMHMIDHAYHMSLRTHSAAKIERSNTESVFDEQTESSGSASAVEEFASDEECVMEEIDWNEGEQICQDDDWNEDEQICQDDDWNEDEQICQDDDWNESGNVSVTDGFSLRDRGWEDDNSGGEWSVQVLKRNGEWSDTESVESKKNEHTAGCDNTDIAQDDWNVEALDTETDWNDVDEVFEDDVNDWGEDLESELATADDWNEEILEPPVNDWSTEWDHVEESKSFPCETEPDWIVDDVGEDGYLPKADDWNVEVLEHAENDCSTGWDDMEDVVTFPCDQCEKQYQHKSSLAKHKFLIHGKRLSRWRNIHSSDEDA